MPTTSSSVQVSASCPVGTIVPNAYTIIATVSGDARFNSSVGSGTLTIGKRTPTVSVDDVTVGVEATEAILTATVSSGSSGVILSGGTFTLSVAGICDSGPLTVPNNDVAASFQFTCVLNGALHGLYTITGNYSGDANFNAGSDTGTLDIHLPTVSLTVAVDHGTVHVVGQNVDETVDTLTVLQIQPGDLVTATVQAQNGITFVGWTWDGVEVGWTNPVTLTMDGEHSLVARFKQTPTFPDVTGGHNYTEAVTQLAARGLILGYGNGNYGPNDRVQRAQMAALIARAMPTGPGTPPTMLTPPGCVVANTWDCEVWGNNFTDRVG